MRWIFPLALCVALAACPTDAAASEPIEPVPTAPTSDPPPTPTAAPVLDARREDDDDDEAAAKAFRDEHQSEHERNLTRRLTRQVELVIRYRTVIERSGGDPENPERRGRATPGDYQRLAREVNALTKLRRRLGIG
jgi:hypothetical protein